MSLKAGKLWIQKQKKYIQKFMEYLNMLGKNYYRKVTTKFI